MIFYTTLLFIFLAGYIFLFVYLFRNKNSLAGNFSLFCLVNIVYLIGTVGILFTKSLDTALIFHKIKYFGYVFIAPTFILFLYNIHFNKISKIGLFLLYLFPIIILVLVATTESHTLYYKSYDCYKINGFTLFSNVKGVFYYIHLAYVVSLRIFGLYLIYRLYHRKERYYVIFSILLLLNMFFGTSLDVLYIISAFPDGVDITAFINVFQLIIYLLAVFYYKLFSPYDFSDSIVPALSTGVIIVDEEYNLVYNNGIALTKLPWLFKFAVGSSLLNSPLQRYLSDEYDSFLIERIEDNKIHHVEFKKSVVNDSYSNKKRLYTFILTDATEQVKDKRNLEKMIKLDGLTKMYNQTAIIDKIKEKYNYAEKNKFNFFVAMLDVDDFKSLNDKYGHLYGNTIIVKIAEIIKEFFICDRYVYGRFAGDEFIIASYNNEEKEFIERLTLFQNTVNNITDENSKDIRIHASVGACLIDFQEFDIKVDYTDIIDIADKAMYEAKRTKHSGPIVRSLK